MRSCTAGMDDLSTFDPCADPTDRAVFIRLPGKDARKGALSLDLARLFVHPNEVKLKVGHGALLAVALQHAFNHLEGQCIETGRSM